ncbi:MAG: hypothetical protein JJU28_19595 [Cyclobacteriaceae bacterium]|nr:hypothetical protein [Cyclobacteriaceae bacterium]
MILKMFRDKDLKNITTFTYSDHPYDMYLAKKVAHSKQLKHIEMKSVGELLSAEELHERVADNYPFISYSGVFAHQLNKDKYDLEDWDKVHIRGNTAVHAAIRKLNHLNVNDGEKAIRMLAENRVNSKLLNDFGRENSIKNFEKNYKEKYLNLYSKHENVHITKLHYIYEKFGNHQGYRYSFSRTGKPEDIYFPFADRSFLKLILSSEIDQYIKQDKNSIHHKLFSELDGCEIKKFPFSSGPHWDASKLERKIFRLRNKLKKRILAKIGIDDKKLSRQKQAEFMAANLPYFKEVVHSNPNSGLWDYIDRTNFTNWTSSEELAMKNMKPILRVIPYLKLGI